MTTEERIVRAGRALVAAAPPASRVILFGSYARGDGRSGSDLDFLVIEPDLDHSASESVRLRRALRDLPAAIDVVVVSRDHAERRSKVPGTMIDRALREGRVIAES
jgi:predicted nucleotidyltransferase